MKLYQINVFVQNPSSTVGSSSNIEDYYIEKNAKLTLVYQMGFKKIMSDFFMDNKDIARRIAHKELNYYDVPKIVTFFNKSLE